jgi:hypothetical protein
MPAIVKEAISLLHLLFRLKNTLAKANASRFHREKIIKVLLANKHKARLRQILCVSYTNHALDQLLVYLKHDNCEVRDVPTLSANEERKIPL